MSQDFSKGYVHTITDNVTLVPIWKAGYSEHKSIMWLSTLEIGKAQLRSALEIALNHRFYREQRPYPVWFSYQRKYIVNIAFKP